MAKKSKSAPSADVTAQKQTAKRPGATMAAEDYLDFLIQSRYAESEIKQRMLLKGYDAEEIAELMEKHYHRMISSSDQSTHKAATHAAFFAFFVLVFVNLIFLVALSAMNLGSNALIYLIKSVIAAVVSFVTVITIFKHSYDEYTKERFYAMTGLFVAVITLAFDFVIFLLSGVPMELLTPLLPYFAIDGILVFGVWFLFGEMMG
ncbi:MAG: hypothetical protein V1911_01020 [Candidatus Micrarchaeota archaeon]